MQDLQLYASLTTLTSLLGNLPLQTLLDFFFYKDFGSYV